jgi:hypothetical protein
MRKVRSSRHNRRHQPSTAVRLKLTVANGIRAVTDSPLIKFTTGMVLLTSGLDEAIETIFADLSALELGAHHGVMVLGFVNVLSSLPDMLDGLSSTFLVDEKGEEPADADIAPVGVAASPPPAGLNDQRERQRRAA